MLINFLIYFGVLLIVKGNLILGQESTTSAGNLNSKIKGPLVSLQAGSFADTLMVLLQSLYYNDNEFQLESQTETVTVLGVNLIAEFEGSLKVLEATVQKSTVLADGKTVHLLMNVPTMQVNKTYSIRSANDPGYSSQGFVTLQVSGGQLYITMSTTQIPYFVDSVTRISSETMETTITGQGIPLAEEIQEALQALVKSQFITVDVSTIYEDIQNKFTDIFNNNELILCLSCEQSYCQCYD